eukprot:815068_1
MADSTKAKRSLRNSNNGNPKKKPKIGKGHKYCKNCKAVIGARCASCKQCKFVYPFKGKPRSKPDCPSKRLLMANAHQNYKHETFPANLSNNQEEDQNNPFKQDHSSFMKTKPYFVDIEPKQKQYIDTGTVDAYINESQLLLDSAFEQISKFGDLESAAKILNRSLVNLTFLATLCDSNEHHGDKCPDLNDFI